MFTNMALDKTCHRTAKIITEQLRGSPLKKKQRIQIILNTNDTLLEQPIKRKRINNITTLSVRNKMKPAEIIVFNNEKMAI